MAELAHDTAHKLRDSADYVRTHDGKEMMSDIESFVKSHSGQSLIAARIIGFLAGRVQQYRLGTERRSGPERSIASVLQDIVLILVAVVGGATRVHQSGGICG